MRKYFFRRPPRSAVGSPTRGDRQSLVLEPLERLVDRRDRHVAPGAPDDLVVDRHAVALVAQPDQGQQDQLLELAEDGGSPPYADFLDDVEDMKVPLPAVS